MGYLHISNLYKDQTILLFRECYALEKIHGTSAHVSWQDGRLGFFSGGVNHDSFVALFDKERLTYTLEALGHQKTVVYGEAYGGKCQGMRDTYGPDLRFVAFDVQINASWLNVMAAEEVAKALGFDFVHYDKSSTDVAALDALRDAPSIQANKNGMGVNKLREGIVLRPLVEMTTSNGERAIAKHKGEAFAERARTPRVSTGRLEVETEAHRIAEEWVTEMRLAHVLDKLKAGRVLPLEIQDTPLVISAMIEDVEREAKGEILESKASRRAIGSAAARLFKRRLVSLLSEVNQ